MSTVAEIEMMRRLAALSRSYQNYLKNVEYSRRRQEIAAHWAKVCDHTYEVKKKND